MSKADKIFLSNLRDIIDNGFWDTDLNVRPKWEDGTPAHTVKKFCIVNRYDLNEEFPIITVRKTNMKNALDEILWSWCYYSNNVVLSGDKGERMLIQFSESYKGCCVNVYHAWLTINRK